MEAALLPDDRTDFVSTRLRTGWAMAGYAQKMANQSRDSASQKPIFSPIWLTACQFLLF